MFRVLSAVELWACTNLYKDPSLPILAAPPPTVEVSSLDFGMLVQTFTPQNSTIHNLTQIVRSLVY
jgi:hypothetical protein